MDLESLVGPVVRASGLELVEASFQRGPGRAILRVLVDREGGVDVEATAEAAERIGRRLDLEGFGPGAYTVEGSSPGVERPLRRPEDFARRVGEKVKVKTARPVEGARSITGTIVGTGPREVRIATRSEEHTSELQSR